MIYQGPSKKQQYERKLFKEKRNNIKCSYEQQQVTKIKFHFQNLESLNLPFNIFIYIELETTILQKLLQSLQMLQNSS